MNEWAEHRDPRRGSNPGPPRGPGQRRKRRPARQGLGLGSLGDGLKPLLLQVFRELLQDLLRGDLRSLISEAFGKPVGKALTSLTRIRLASSPLHPGSRRPALLPACRLWKRLRKAGEERTG